MMGVKSSKTARQLGDGTEVPKSSFTKHVRSIIASLIEDGIFERGTTIVMVQKSTMTIPQQKATTKKGLQLCNCKDSTIQSVAHNCSCNNNIG